MQKSPMRHCFNHTKLQPREKPLSKGACKSTCAALFHRQKGPLVANDERARTRTPTASSMLASVGPQRLARKPQIPRQSQTPHEPKEFAAGFDEAEHQSPLPFKKQIEMPSRFNFQGDRVAVRVNGGRRKRRSQNDAPDQRKLSCFSDAGFVTEH